MDWFEEQWGEIEDAWHEASSECRSCDSYGAACVAACAGGEVVPVLGIACAGCAGDTIHDCVSVRNLFLSIHP
jgi:hypothetical protein